MDSSFRRSLDKISEPGMKRKGERGSPCLRPCVGKNLPYGTPSKRMEKEDVDRH
jgi:hypothetical protein